MRYLHATHRKNLPSIRRRGLLASRSRGNIRSCWFAFPSLLHWAVLHAVRRHKCRAEDVVVIEVFWSRSQAARSRVRGLCHSRGADVPADRLGRALMFEEFSSVACVKAGREE